MNFKSIIDNFLYGVQGSVELDFIQQEIELKHITKQEVVDFIRVLFPSEVDGLSDDLILKKFSLQIKKYIDYKLRILPQKDNNYIFFSSSDIKNGLQQLKKNYPQYAELNTNELLDKCGNQLMEYISYNYIRDCFKNNIIYLQCIDMFRNNHYDFLTVFPKEYLLSANGKQLDSICSNFFTGFYSQNIDSLLADIDFQNASDLDICKKICLAQSSSSFIVKFLTSYCESDYYSAHFISSLFQDNNFLDSINIINFNKYPLNKNFYEQLNAKISSQDSDLIFWGAYHYDSLSFNNRIRFFDTLINSVNYNDYFDNGINDFQKYRGRIGDIGTEVITPSQVAGFVAPGSNKNHMHLLSAISSVLYAGRVSIPSVDNRLLSFCRDTNDIFFRLFNTKDDDHNIDQVVIIYVPEFINNFQQDQLFQRIRNMIQINKRRKENGVNMMICGSMLKNGYGLIDSVVIDEDFLEQVQKNIEISNKIIKPKFERSLEGMFNRAIIESDLQNVEVHYGISEEDYRSMKAG